MDDLAPRRGPQVIPRPATARPGEPAPWEGASRPQLDMDRLRELLGRVLVPPGALQAPEADFERPAAVLAPLYEHEGRLEVVLTRRARHLRRHRGEVSFPGGRMEDRDSSLIETALREAHEEVALPAEIVEITGGLEPLRTLSARSFIAPYVGILPARPSLRPDPAEVERILHVPIDDLLADGVYREELWGPPGSERPICFFEIDGDTIWGATAAILRDLLSRMVLGEPAPRWSS